MSVKLNRDDLIRQKIKDFEKSPPEEIWDGIKKGLSSEKRRMIPLYLKYAAGIILFLGTVSLLRYLLPSEKNYSPVITMDEKAPISEQEIKPGAAVSDATNSDITESAKVENIKKEEVLKETNFYGEINSSMENPSEDRSSGHESLIAEDIQNDRNTVEPVYVALQESAGGSIPVQITPYNPENPMIVRAVSTRLYSWNDLEPEEFPESKEREGTVFSLGAMMTPIYSYRDISGVSASLNEFFNDSESGKFSYAGGLNFGISAGKRFSVHSGLVYNRMGVAVNNIMVVAELRESLSDEIRYEPDATSPYLVSNSIGSIKSSSPEKANFDYSSLNPASSSSAISTNLNYLNSGGFYAPADNYVEDEGSIDQLLHYFEIPLILRYKLIDRKLDLGLLGGMSTNFLVGNQVIYNQNGNTDIIGSTSDIRKVNYSGNIGLGLNYNLSEQFRFLFEPQLKYYLNSINKEALIINRPYSIGLYTGLIYLF